MSKSVSTYTHGMFHLSAYWAGMEVNTVEDLPHYCVEVMDPDTMVSRPMYVRITLAEGYEGKLDLKTIGYYRNEMIAEVTAWHLKLGVEPVLAVRAAERVPMWHLSPEINIPMGSLNGSEQSIGLKMLFTPIFTLKAFRKDDHRVFNCQSNIFGKWTEYGQDYPWVLEDVRTGPQGGPAVQYGGLVVDREAFTESLNDQILKRWPYMAHADLAEVRPVFELLTLAEFHKLFPRARMILDPTTLKK